MLTTHVTASVGWFGAILVFLALSLIGLTSEETEIVRAVYLVMEPAAWGALVPLAAASLVTGLIQSLGGKWGVLRHYWVLFKLLINIGALVILLMYTQTLGYLAEVAASGVDLDGLRSPSVAVHAVLALVFLLCATVLAVYKPKGQIRNGRVLRWRPRLP